MGVMKNIYTTEKENIIKNEVNRFFSLLSTRRPDVSFNVIRKRDGRYGVGDTQDDFPANNVLNASTLLAARPLAQWDRGTKKNRHYWLETYVFDVTEVNKPRLENSLHDDYYCYDDFDTLAESIRDTLDQEWRFLDAYGDRIDPKDLIRFDDDDAYVFTACGLWALAEELLSAVDFCKREEKTIVFEVCSDTERTTFTVDSHTTRESIDDLVVKMKPSTQNPVNLETYDVYDTSAE